MINPGSITKIPLKKQDMIIKTRDILIIKEDITENSHIIVLTIIEINEILNKNIRKLKEEISVIIIVSEINQNTVFSGILHQIGTK